MAEVLRVAEGVPVLFAGWTVNDSFLARLRAFGSTWGRVGLANCVWKDIPVPAAVPQLPRTLTALHISHQILNDNLMMLLLLYGRCITNLTVKSTNLRSDWSEWSVERWEEVTIGNITREGLIRMPPPATRCYFIQSRENAQARLFMHPRRALVSARVGACMQ